MKAKYDIGNLIVYFFNFILFSPRGYRILYSVYQQNF